MCVNDGMTAAAGITSGGAATGHPPRDNLFCVRHRLSRLQKSNVRNLATNLLITVAGSKGGRPALDWF